MMLVSLAHGPRVSSPPTRELYELVLIYGLGYCTRVWDRQTIDRQESVIFSTLLTIQG